MAKKRKTRRVKDTTNTDGLDFLVELDDQDVRCMILSIIEAAVMDDTDGLVK